MEIRSEELKSRLTPEIRGRIIRDNWHSHDARWFLKVSAEFGFDVANRLNKATIRSMGRTEMRRLLDELGIDEVNTVDDFAAVASIACEVYFPPGMFDGETRATGEDAATGTVRKCWVSEEVRKAGVTGFYECACGARHEGWLEACGLRADVQIAKSMLRGDPVCEISATSVRRLQACDEPENKSRRRNP